jgi:hypothetical protein
MTYLIKSQRTAHSRRVYHSVVGPYDKLMKPLRLGGCYISKSVHIFTTARGRKFKDNLPSLPPQYQGDE